MTTGFHPHNHATGNSSGSCCMIGRRALLSGAAAAGFGLAVSSPISALAAKPSRGARRIDVHHHFATPLFKKAAIDHKLLNEQFANHSTSLALEEMDRNDVATAILSLPSPGVWYGDVSQARNIARDANEAMARMAFDYPGRFGFFASLSLPDVDGSLTELAYALDVLKADGIHLLTSYGDFWLGDRRLTPLLAELDRRKTVAYVHPTTANCCENLISAVPRFLVEYGADTTRTIADLIFSGAAAKYPNIRWIFSHGGGAAPFLIERFVTQENLLKQRPDGTKAIPNGVLHELQRFRYETAQVANPYAMAPLTRLVPKSQILFGTDYPYREIADNVQGLAKCGFFTRAELAAVEHSNAASLFPRFAI